MYTGAYAGEGIAYELPGKTDPTNVQDLVRTSNGYYIAGNHELAKEAFEEAIAIDPRYPDAWAWPRRC